MTLIIHYSSTAFDIFFDITNLIILADVHSFVSLKTDYGCITCPPGYGGVPGCDGKIIVTPSFRRGKIE